MKNRAAKTAAVMASGGSGGGAVAAAAAPRKQSLIEWILNIPKFVREVRAEGRKITWTSWKETWITSVMVAIMVVLASIFFAATDFGLSAAMNFVLKIANG